MGSQFATYLASDYDLTIEEQLEIHLKSNHFPPVPSTMIQPCIDAIDAINCYDAERLISLPEGVGYRGLTVAPAYAIAEAHHLDAWLSEEE